MGLYVYVTKATLALIVNTFIRHVVERPLSVKITVHAVNALTSVQMVGTINVHVIRCSLEIIVRWLLQSVSWFIVTTFVVDTFMYYNGHTSLTPVKDKSLNC